MTLRVCLSKGEKLCFLSHLDFMKTLLRAMRRVEIPLAFSKGFNPRPRVSMGPPLPVGLTSEAEYMDIELDEEVSLLLFSKNLATQLPEDLCIRKVKVLEEGTSLMALLDTACYSIPFPTTIKREDQVDRFTHAYHKGDLTVLRTKKGRTKRVDLRPLIKSYHLTPKDSTLEIVFYVSIGQRGNVRPEELLEVFPDSIENLERPSLTEVKRIGLYYEKEGSFLPPF